MTALFYISAAVAVVATGLAITRRVTVHALLYLIVSLLSVALVFYGLGAPFVAALEVIVYAGAIMVLFLFVIMLLNLGPEAVARQRRGFVSEGWLGPAILSAILFIELIYAFVAGGTPPAGVQVIEPKLVGIALFGPYVLGVELASTLLLAGLVGAYHLGRGHESVQEEPEGRA